MSAAKVRLAHGLTLPAAELATEVVASLGNRGGGKSNGAAVVAEGLLAAGVPVVVLDYVGIWFSLRLAPDGKTPSPFQIPVLGGRHGDIGLAPTTGTIVAEALARTQSSAVLDISGFSKADRCRFATDFAEAFFRAKKDHPGPVQLLLEEAQRFVPQKLFTGQERMLGAFEEIGEVGRNYGIGLHLISQRPQKINKDVLNLADTVFGYRTNGVLERKAIAEWVQEKGAEGRANVQGELPGLERGSAIVWCPSRKIFGRYAIEKKSTYDAGATPIHARAAVKTKPLDLNSLESAMGKAVEDAKANDPRALRAEIERLRRDLGNGVAPPKPERVVEYAVPPAFPGALTATEEALDVVLRAVERLKGRVGEARAISLKSPPVAARAPAPRQRPDRPAPAPSVGDAADLSRCARALLCVLAQRGIASDSQISAFSGYRKTSSGFANSLSELRTQGLIDGPKERRTITQKGRDVVGPTEPLPTGKALLDYWLPRLGKCEAAMLKAIFDAGSISRKDLSTATDYSLTSSGFSNGISGLRVLDLVRGQHGGDLTIADVFTEGAI
jgi:hypothetical protein